MKLMEKDANKNLWNAKLNLSMLVRERLQSSVMITFLLLLIVILILNMVP